VKCRSCPPLRELLEVDEGTWAYFHLEHAERRSLKPKYGSPDVWQALMAVSEVKEPIFVDSNWEEVHAPGSLLFLLAAQLSPH
jgi:hypothetical protein